MKQRYLVEIMPGMQFECGGEGALGISLGDSVVVNFEKYTDCGLVTRLGTAGGGGATDGSSTQGGDKGKRSGGQEKEPEIMRLMTATDFRKAETNEGRSVSMFKTAQRKVHEHHLVMKLINCHYSLDKTITFFQFSAEGRVDFRSLVRDLSGALHTRIELRQIGVRDEAGIIGGIGVCGQPFCCARFLNRFYSVNVKMAKIQRLSLNPASVSGGCGRLKCCLRYEVDGYKEMGRDLPRTGSRCETPDGCGRVMDCNALTQKVRVRLDHGSAQYKDFDVADVKPAPVNQRSQGDAKRDRGDGKSGKNDGQAKRSENTDDTKSRRMNRKGQSGKRKGPQSKEGGQGPGDGKANRRHTKHSGGRASRSGGAKTPAKGENQG